MVVEFILDIETTGLNKEESRITCISVKQINTGDMITIIDEDEKVILTSLFQKLHHCDYFYTFNGDEFDIPFIIYRALILDVKAPEGFKMPKHVDLRKIVNSFFYNYDKYQKGSLNVWAERIGLQTKLTNGLECIKAWEEKNYQLIKEHCEYDVEITYKLFERCKNLGLITG